MPKNAVQRLQKIDNDIKTVLSIYDLANHSSGKDDTSSSEKGREALLFSKINTAKCWEASLLLDKLRDESAQSPSLLFESLKQIENFNSQFEHGTRPPESSFRGRKNLVIRKPSLMPSSSSTLSTICESGYKLQRSSETNTGTSENSSGLRTKTSDNLNFSDWIDSNSFPGECDAYMTPSKTLLTANEILALDYSKRDKNVNKDYTHEVSYTVGQVTPNIQTQENKDIDKDKTNKVPENLFPVSRRSKTSHSDFHIAFSKEQYDISPEKPRSQKSQERESHLPVKTFGHKMCRDTQNTKTLAEIFPSGSLSLKKIQKMENSGSSESAIQMKSYGKRKELLGHQEKTSKVEEEKRKKNSIGDRKEKKSKSISEKEKKFNSEKMRKSSEMNESDIRATELSKIIEKSNEKLEKMKVSKGLALDIAKQLKDKYDEIKQSKEELLEKLQTVEKDNERLNNEIKNAQESSVKLELKMEGLKKNSKTMLQEQEIKTTEILEENARLKVKITELEMEQRQQLLQKQNQIDQLQKERLLEIQNELKSRETRAEDLQKLRNEKTKLIAKIEELQSELKDRKSKVESHEEKIRQLQEELQKQQQHLKKKTDKLEETNKELKSIRKNSTDLEEQIKHLRKNVENFDDLHKNLMKQTMEYEQKVKINQEEIQTLKNDNTKLNVELNNEKDALLIKNKIIEDQQESIRQLREKGEENKTLLKRNQSLERLLNMERDEKLELQEAVERLKWRKEELKNRIKSLENDLLLAPQAVVKDLKKTQIVLHELENQVQIKQKEWELHLQALIREKEQACSVAEFATKKLMQTTIEFQKQSEAHKRLHRALAENLAEKERHLREATEKVTKTWK